MSEKSDYTHHKIAIDKKTETLLLLHLWSLDGLSKPLKQAVLTQQVKLTTQKAEDYQSLYEKLAQEGYISIIITANLPNILLTEKGLRRLDFALKSPDFEYRPQQKVRTKDFNALLKWIREGGIIDQVIVKKEDIVIENIEKQKDIVVNNLKKIEEIITIDITTEEIREEIEVEKFVKEIQSIKNYQDFQSVILDIYNQINRQEHLEHFVPIYSIRRKIGNQISRPQFDEWFLQMQQDKIFQLLGADFAIIPPDEVKDSIQPPQGNLRYYARLMNAEVNDSIGEEE